MSVIKTLICHIEIEFNGVYFVWFCTKYDARFSKYRIKLIVILFSTNVTKKEKKKNDRTGTQSILDGLHKLP